MDRKTYITRGLTLLDAIDISRNLLLATCELEQGTIRPVVVCASGSNAARCVSDDAVMDYVVDRVWSWLLVYKDDRLLRAALNLNAILGSIEIGLAGFGCKELDERMIGARLWHGDRLKSTAPYKSL